MDVLTLLIFVIVLCVWAQPTDGRKEVAFVFAALYVIHEGCFAGLDGFAYYFSAGLFDAAIVLVLARMPHTPLTLPIQLLSLTSLLANGAGWLAWSQYMPPIYYNTFYVGLYAVAIILLLRGSDALRRCKAYLGVLRLPRVTFANGCHGYKMQGETEK